MPPRTKRAKNIAAGTSARAEKEKISGWERSKISSQDHRMLKKMGLLKDEAMQMPGDESIPHPLEGWRKKWLYVKDESTGTQQYGMAPLDMSQEILRRKSWDAEATPEEMAATESLIARIKSLQTTQGQELSGVQIIAHFLRIRVQPFQARANPLWLYSGDSDAARISNDLSVKDLEKLVRRFTSLSKKSEIPASCRVEPFSGAHALPANHQVLSSLPPAPEGGDVPERAIITDDSQETSVCDSEPAESEKSAGSSDRISESEQASGSSETNSVPPATTPEKRKRKRTPDEEDSGTSKMSQPTTEEPSPEEQENFDPFASAANVSSDDEEPLDLDAPKPANTITSHTLVLSEDPPIAPETSAPPRSPRVLKKKPRTGAAGKEVVATGSLLTPLLDDPVMKEMVNIGSRFIGFRDEADSLRKALHLAEKRANDLERKLKASEKARKKAEEDAAGIEDLRDRLHAAENALSDKEEKLPKREAAMIARFETQSVRFSKKIGEMYTRNQDSEEDPLLDTLTVLEMNCTLARDCLKAARIAFERIFPHFFPKTELPEKFDLIAKHFTGKGDPALAYRQASLKIGVEGTIALVTPSGEKVDWAKVAAVRGLNSDKWTALIKGSKAFSKRITAILDPKSSAFASTAQTEVK
ncbi:hypothetical protein QYE76_059032 [Lolium multiflorum]|uniref:Uncharacterized protein n=1 Tax=Lolium multiflorum TaxID=4521 RepID=A0AAD8T6M1_LOLMU|nr:hypothetical protein QYE76_059032 [Lolium multiflorum]